MEGHHEERPAEHARPVGARGGQDPRAPQEVLGAPGVDPARPQRVPGEEAPLLPQVLLPVQRGASRDPERDQRPQQVTAFSSRLIYLFLLQFVLCISTQLLELLKMQRENRILRVIYCLLCI